MYASVCMCMGQGRAELHERGAYPYTFACAVSLL